ncbi:MAG: radical SAM protein [Elusimicrobia bacterium]|nr:radical SAM protein [Elusimicrobiota bacterium]
MKVQRVFLIKPAYADSYYDYNDLPAGLGYVSQALEDHGIETRVFDLHLSEGSKKLFAAIKAFAPQIIGLGLLSYRFKKHYELIDSIKAEFPGISIVAGGSHVSTFRERVLERCPSIDFGVVMEGDETIVELCGNVDDPSKVKGVLHRAAGGVRYSGDRPFIQDLDKLSFPKYARFELGRYPFITIITSRGCPYRCIYCSVLYSIGKQWRCRSARSVVDELEHWHKRGFRQFEFGDDNFTLKRERVVEICDEIERRGLKGLEIGLGNGIRADRVDKPLLARMKEVGFSYVAFGIESVSNRVLEKLRKGETIEKIEEGVKAAIEVGFPVDLFFLLGSPTETEEDVRASVAFALKYPVKDVAFYNIIPFPTSELYQMLMETKAFLRDPETHLNDSNHWFYSPVFETPELSEKDRIRLLKWANEVTKRHTVEVRRKHVVDQLMRAGVPKAMAALLARIREFENLKRPLRKLGLIDRFKKFAGIRY